MIFRKSHTNTVWGFTKADLWRIAWYEGTLHIWITAARLGAHNIHWGE
jgi:hypothetical protein